MALLVRTLLGNSATIDNRHRSHSQQENSELRFHSIGRTRVSLGDINYIIAAHDSLLSVPTRRK